MCLKCSHTQVDQIHEQLSTIAPATEADIKDLEKYLTQKTWNSLFFVCDNLAILPDAVRMSSSVKVSDIQKREMARKLIEWVR